MAADQRVLLRQGSVLIVPGLNVSSSLSVLVLPQLPLRAQMRHAKERKMDFWS